MFRGEELESRIEVVSITAREEQEYHLIEEERKQEVILEEALE